MDKDNPGSGCYGPGFQPLALVVLKPGALPQAGMERAVGAGQLGVSGERGEAADSLLERRVVLLL